MSGAMEAAMRAWERGLSSVQDKMVCASHIDDYAVRHFIKSSGGKGKCDYCGKHKIVIELEKVMEFLTDALLHFYTDPANFMSYESAEGGYQGDFDGPWEMLESLGLEVEDSLLNDDIIESLDPTSAWADEGVAVADFKYEGWLNFKYLVKHRSRYLFSPSEDFRVGERAISAEDFLKELAADIRRQRMITTIPVGTPIFRCRQHINPDDVSAAHHICSPEIIFAIYPNRMSPAGVSMFYGALDKKLAMSETLDEFDTSRPYFTVAEFCPKEDLCLIDLSKVPYISPFDQEKWELYDRIEFLRRFLDDFSNRITHDGKEHIEYVPTQVVTEYFRFNFKHHGKPVDGILYPSSKNKRSNACVLFMDHYESLDRLSFDPVKCRTRKVVPQL
jgi:hypothetical protein